MTRREIIHLRASGESIEALAERINRSIENGGGTASNLELYRRHGLETDLAVHILSSDLAMKTGPSELALRLASELRAFGLVEHTIWEELR